MVVKNDLIAFGGDNLKPTFLLKLRQRVPADLNALNDLNILNGLDRCGLQTICDQEQPLIQ